MYDDNMAEQMFMFATTAGVMIGLGVILGIARTRRSRTTAPTEIANESSYSQSSSSTQSSSSSSPKGESSQRRVKRYNSDGKPVYE
ncbi:MAG TPA: hypothetical protein VKA95_13085 [Nitrososphaeraceae archaeon]|jgi:hypothetical protein|nr:hypothetical protein [Nitrososphaeraceae archaeon]